MCCSAGKKMLVTLSFVMCLWGLIQGIWFFLPIGQNGAGESASEFSKYVACSNSADSGAALAALCFVASTTDDAVDAVTDLVDGDDDRRRLFDGEANGRDPREGEDCTEENYEDCYSERRRLSDGDAADDGDFVDDVLDAVEDAGDAVTGLLGDALGVIGLGGSAEAIGVQLTIASGLIMLVLGIFAIFLTCCFDDCCGGCLLKIAFVTHLIDWLIQMFTFVFCIYVIATKTVDTIPWAIGIAFLGLSSVGALPFAICLCRYESDAGNKDLDV